jgi:formylglycine-generating enzyme required for sulfatase activity/tRNA A-37 threonylcarbamoyl transferase component Bud32
MRASSETWPRGALPCGTVLHGYEIDAILGRGGFGITYRAHDRIGKIFAIKESFPRQFAERHGLDIVPSDPGDAETLADCLDRFLREAKALDQLSEQGAAGDGVVKIVTLFEANRTAYLVMEYVAGQSLEALIKANPGGIEPERLAQILDLLLRALGCVHDSGLLHRDLKPANILLRADFRPVLIDFGAVRTVGAANQNTAFTQIYAKSFAPIEQQLAGAKQGRYSDLFALGMTCYQAIGGTPIDAVTRQHAMHGGASDPLPPATRIGAGRYPPLLLEALDSCLKVASADRPQSVAEMRVLLSGDDTVVVPDARPEQVPDPARDAVTVIEPRQGEPKRAGMMTLAAILCGVAILGVGVTLVVQQNAREPKRVDEGTPPPAPVAPKTVPVETVAPPKTEAEARKPGSTFRDCPDCAEMVVIPSGSFTMGSPASEAERHEGESPLHRVSVPAFALGKYDVTFAQWEACAANGGCNAYRPDDQGWGRGNRPVINVSWDDARSYIAWLNRKVGSVTGNGAGPYRLPSEAEWEYAARAGTATAWYWGDSIGTGNAVCHDCGSQWDAKETAPVGSFRPNAWGLYDTLGNVWQWTEDCYVESYVGAPSDGTARTTGDCKSRVVRGGSWGDNPRDLRSAVRGGVDTGFRVNEAGFRLARTLP